MNTTTPFLNSQFLQQLQNQVIASTTAMLQATAVAVWPSFRPYVWSFIFIIIMAIMIFIITGATSKLGSLLYHIFYFGILAIVIAIFGFGILFNDYFDLICLLVYIISYTTTGVILGKFAI